MTHVSPDFSELPSDLVPLVEHHWQAFVESDQTLPPSLEKEVPRVWAGSDYVAEQMARRPALTQWLATAAFEGPLNEKTLRDALREQVSACTDESELQSVLRIFRHQHQCRIIWRDLSGGADFSATVADLSLLADVLISEALDWLFAAACERDGTPTDEHGDTVKLVVLAMGKLGARELNLSSDIDLIFTY